MYYIEMFIEVGNWSVYSWADRKLAAETKNDRLKHNVYEWTPTGGYWSRVGGVFASVSEAEAKIAQYKLAEAPWKPKGFRVRQI